MARLEGKVAIITGGASGIGEAAARLFTANGATVVIADIQDELGLKVAASIGPKCCIYKHCDITDEKQVQRTVSYTVVTYGRLDIMFSNAVIIGSTVGASILDFDKEELVKMVAVNVVGPALVVKHAAHAMMGCKDVRGSIVCTASVAAHQGGHGPPTYTAWLHALLGLVRAAAADLGKHRIRINCVSPFMVATGMTASKDTPAEAVENVCPMLSNLKGAMLRPRDVAEAAMFLASEASGFVSGHNLVVDADTSVAYTGISQITANLGDAGSTK